MSWAAATDLGRNFSGSVSGWMNLWGNIGALLSPLLAGIMVDIVGWTNDIRISDYSSSILQLLCGSL